MLKYILLLLLLLVPAVAGASTIEVAMSNSSEITIEQAMEELTWLSFSQKVYTLSGATRITKMGDDVYIIYTPNTVTALSSRKDKHSSVQAKPQKEFGSAMGWGNLPIEDPLTLAKQYEAEGDFKSAAYLYEDVGDIDNSMKCHLAAAQQFENMSEFFNAARHYESAGDFEKMKEMYTKDGEQLESVGKLKDAAWAFFYARNMDKYKELRKKAIETGIEVYKKGVDY